MLTWAFWTLFLALGAAALASAKQLDDRERRRASERDSSVPPVTTRK